jgi:glycosyltransferase involved in cell wall biosynthesis
MTDEMRNQALPPMVSAIIPTRNRSKLLERAIQTALNQTFRDLEVVVVIDGPDPDTEASLKKIGDTRLRVIALSRHVGGSDARNAGVQAARGHWVALLDDDDEWLPEKIERQLAIMAKSRFQNPIASSRLIARSRCSKVIWPFKEPSAPISEYILTRSSWAYGDGMIQTSTILTSRSLLLQVPFRSGLRKHQDLDWVLRAVQHSGVGIEFVHMPLAVWNIQDTELRMTTTPDWEFSRQWIRENRKLVTRRAYAGFLLSHCTAQAAAQGKWGAILPLILEGCLIGSPRLFDFVLCLQGLLAPIKWLRRVYEISRGKPSVLLSRLRAPQTEITTDGRKK